MVLSRRTRELALMYSRKCNIACRHCGIESSPEVSDCLGLDKAREIIVQAAAIPHFAKMTFTGGEPFLFVDAHLELLRLCRDMGLQTRIVTNGFWAKNKERGAKLLEKFRSAGLTELNFSADKFHLEFMTAKATRNALSVAGELGFAKIVSFVTNDTTRSPLDQFAEMYGLERCVVEDLRVALNNPSGFSGLSRDVIYVYAGGLIGLGRASSQAHEIRIFSNDYFPENLSCGEVGNKPVIYPDGAFQACCCAGGKIKAFTVGNVFNEDINSLYAKMESRESFHFINKHGPKALFRLMGASNSGIRRKIGFPSICDMCVHTFESSDARALDEVSGNELVRRFLNDLTGADASSTPAG